MVHEPTSTVRARRLRERRSRGIVMVAPVEGGEGGVELLIGNGYPVDGATVLNERACLVRQHSGLKPVG